MLHLQLPPNHVLIYSLNWIHIYGPKAIKFYHYTLQVRDVLQDVIRFDFRISFRSKWVFHETRINIINCFKYFYN